MHDEHFGLFPPRLVLKLPRLLAGLMEICTLLASRPASSALGPSTVPQVRVDSDMHTAAIGQIHAD